VLGEGFKMRERERERERQRESKLVKRYDRVQNQEGKKD